MKRKYFSVIKLTTMNIKPSAAAISYNNNNDIIKAMQQWKKSRGKQKL